jgi:hypothetical protein
LKLENLRINCTEVSEKRKENSGGNFFGDTVILLGTFEEKNDL